MSTPTIILSITLASLAAVLVAAGPQTKPALPATPPPPAPVLTDGGWVNLYPGKAPDAQGDGDEDTPAVQVFLPQGKSTGIGIVVCAGGGYGARADHEGRGSGMWLGKQGVTAFVLRYRLGPRYHHPVEMHDAQRAMRFVRTYASQWKLAEDKIGIMGYSAGGHLASTVATHFDAGDAKSDDPIERASSRPDFQALIYPVITMRSPLTHEGSKLNLLGPNPSPDLVELLSNERHVTVHTPPAFLVHSTVDPVVPVANSDNYAAALRSAGIRYEYVRGSIGGHGFGLADSWTPQFLHWLGLPPEHK